MIGGFFEGMPSISGGDAGPATSEAGQSYSGGENGQNFSSPFIVGGEGNSASSGGANNQFLIYALLALGALWILKK